MKAISLWRPWPWAFFHAGKRIENRSWKPPDSIIGTWVAMHAAQRFDEDAGFRMLRGDFGAAAQALPIEHGTTAIKHPTGIVGAMFVAGRFEKDGARYGFHRNCDEVDALLRAGYASPWSFGPFCWLTPRVVELAEPIPCKGKQGLWTVPVEIAKVVEKRIEEEGT